jgi:prepilin-type processing-associated H-X9-DG protein
MMRQAFLIAVLAAAQGAAPGCGHGTATAEVDNSAEAQGLRNLGTMYKLVSESLGRPPKTIAELRQAEARVPGGFSDIGETNVAIYLGADMAGKPADEASNTVLAYDRLTPHQGGHVLMLDGSVKTMTAAEFKSAKKAGTKPWTSAPGS